MVILACALLLALMRFLNVDNESLVENFTSEIIAWLLACLLAANLVTWTALGQRLMLLRPLLVLIAVALVANVSSIWFSKDLGLRGALLASLAWVVGATLLYSCLIRAYGFRLPWREQLEAADVA